MPILLTCLTEPGTGYSCCEQPYVPTTSDCVLECLTREQLALTRASRLSYAGMLSFGTKGAEGQEQRIQDLQQLTVFLYDLFLDRVATVTGGGADWNVASIWEQYDLACVSKYFTCRYGIDIRPWLLHAGLYDPAHPPTASVIVQLPIPYEVPCGDPQPEPPVPPEPNCLIPTFMIVEAAVDVDFEASAQPSLTYLLVTNTGLLTGGWADHINEVATPSGFLSLPDGTNIGIQGSDQIWTLTSGVFAEMFPPVTGTILGLDLTVAVLPVDPTWTITVVVSNGTEQETVYQGLQSALPPTLTTTLDSVIVIRTTYTVDDCAYGPFESSLANACGDLEVTYQPEALCGTGTWQINVDVISVDTYAGGLLRERVNGSLQSSGSLVVGPLVFGPYQPGDTVSFTVVHPDNPTCNINSADFTDPTPVADPLVYLPVVFTQNTITLVYVATIPVIHPTIVASNPSVSLVYDCGGGDVEFYNGPINSFVPIPLDPQPACDAATIVGAIIYDVDCDVRIDAEIAEYTPPSEVDPTFNGGLNGIPLALARQPFGKFLAGGTFTQYDQDAFGPITAIPANRYTRFNRDGSLDTAYNDVVNDPLLPPTGANCRGFDGRVDAIEVDSQDRVVISGWFTLFNNAPAPHIIRLNPDGTVDSAFMANVNAGFNSITVFDVAIDSTDRIVCTGFFTDYDGTAVSRICRLNEDGTLDATFVSDGLNGSGYKNIIAPDGTIVINSGQFSTYDDAAPPVSHSVLSGAAFTVNVPPITVRKTLVRINDDGTYNSTIAQGVQFECVAAPTFTEMEIQSDGKILVSGSFVRYDGTTVGRIARLNADGTPDATFMANATPGFDQETSGLAVLPNGMVMVGCKSSANYQDVTMGSPLPGVGLVRLLADGKLDPTWNIGTGFSGPVYAVMVDSFGSLVVGGDFVTFQGVPKYRIVKFL